jgi:hypothetical protein
MGNSPLDHKVEKSIVLDTISWSRRDLLYAVGGFAAAAMLSDCGGPATTALPASAPLSDLAVAMQKIGMSQVVDVDGTVYKSDGTITKPSSVRATMNAAPVCTQNCGTIDGTQVICIESTPVQFTYSLVQTNNSYTVTLSGQIGGGGFDGEPQSAGPQYSFSNVPKIPACAGEGSAGATALAGAATYIAKNASSFTVQLVNAADDFIEEWGPAGEEVAAGAALAFIGLVLADAGPIAVATILAGAGITGLAIWGALSCFEHGSS